MFNGVPNVQNVQNGQSFQNSQASTSRNVMNEQPPRQTAEAANRLRRELFQASTGKVLKDIEASNSKRLETILKSGIVPIIEQSIAPMYTEAFRSAMSSGGGSRNLNASLERTASAISPVINDLITPLIQSTMAQVSAQGVTLAVVHCIQSTLHDHFLKNLSAEELSLLQQRSVMLQANGQGQQRPQQPQQSTQPPQAQQPPQLRAQQSNTTDGTPALQNQRKRPRVSALEDDDVDSGQSDVDVISHIRHSPSSNQDVVYEIEKIKRDVSSILLFWRGMSKTHSEQMNAINVHTQQLHALHNRLVTVEERSNLVSVSAERLQAQDMRQDQVAEEIATLHNKCGHLFRVINQKADIGTLGGAGTDSNSENSQNFRLEAIEDLLKRNGERMSAIENNKAVLSGKLQNGARSRSSTPLPQQQQPQPQQDSSVEDRLTRRMDRLENLFKGEMDSIKQEAREERDKLRAEMLSKIDEKFDGLKGNQYHENRVQEEKYDEMRDVLLKEMEQGLRIVTSTLKQRVAENHSKLLEQGEKQERRVADLEGVLKKSYEESW